MYHRRDVGGNVTFGTHVADLKRHAFSPKSHRYDAALHRHGVNTGLFRSVNQACPLVLETRHRDWYPRLTRVKDGETET